jgi:hypothetical protein
LTAWEFLGEELMSLIGISNAIGFGELMMC